MSRYLTKQPLRVETEVIRVEMNDCIKQFIDELPDNYRSVIVLSDIEGFRNKEIADILRVSLETVKIRLHRARQELKRKLETGCEFYRDERDDFACDRRPIWTPRRRSSPVSFFRPNSSKG